MNSFRCPFLAWENRRPKWFFFVICFIKLGRFWWNLVHCLLNKFAAKLFKRFHLAWTMYLHYLVNLEILISHVLPLSCQRKLQYLSHLNCGGVASKFARFEFSWLHCVGILREEVYKTRITHLDLSTTPLKNACGNDDVIQLGPLRSQSLFQCVQSSDAYFEHLLLQYSLHSVTNWI